MKMDVDLTLNSDDTATGMMLLAVSDDAAEAAGMTEEEPSDPTGKHFLDTFDVNITIAFPGPVGESSGTIDGNTVTWAAKIGEENKLTARGSAVSPEEAAVAAAAAEASASPSAAPVDASDQNGSF